MAVAGPAASEAWSEAARLNHQGLSDLAFTSFRRAEHGWAVYQPLIAREIGSKQAGDSPDFAAALASWQSAHHLGHVGVIDDATLSAMNLVWLRRRPFLAASRLACPPGATDAELVAIPADRVYGGKTLRLRSEALGAYGQMLGAARAELPVLKADLRLLTVFSAYRDPDADAARCVQDGNCQGVARAACSAHATGLAMDLFLGSAPGLPPDSSDDANRLHMSLGAPYRWLVTNAARFGFVPYPFEPWHWEWTPNAANDAVGP